LSDLENVDFKQKALWRQIYDNAITDRKNAYLMWTDLYIYIHGHEEQHFKHGQTAIKYLEKMEKSNEQILKLAALVEKAILKEVEEDFPSADEIFEKSEKKFKK
jgi:predicted secreted Zn-dependent protease